jgi:hypothetical protein
MSLSTRSSRHLLCLALTTPIQPCTGLALPFRIHFSRPLATTAPLRYATEAAEHPAQHEANASESGEGHDTQQPPNRRQRRLAARAQREASLSSAPARETPTPRPSNPRSPPAPRTSTASHSAPAPKPQWRIQKESLALKFGSEGWSPRKKLSPDAQSGIRALHASNPTLYSTPILAEQFKVSAEAIRRILKSKWLEGESGEKMMQERRERWAKRFDRIADNRSELGLRRRRGRDRRVREVGEASEEVEGERLGREVLERARAEHPLFREPGASSS